MESEIVVNPMSLRYTMINDRSIIPHAARKHVRNVARIASLGDRALQSHSLGGLVGAGRVSWPDRVRTAVDGSL